jgi:hypothetical protein
MSPPRRQDVRDVFDSMHSVGVSIWAGARKFVFIVIGPSLV